ncbi:MAG: hypothetical protein ACXWEF_05215 [Solirubrobacterales bacterium]
MPTKKGNDDDLLAFANAVGNYSDLAAEAREGGPSGATGEGIFDFDGPDPEPEPEPEPELEPATAEHDEVEDSADPPVREAIVPLLGMRMAVPEVDLGYAGLVCAGKLADAPPEAFGSHNNVFAAIGCGGSMQAPHAATHALQQLVTTLRLLKPGGVGLAAHGWVPGLNGWQRFSTGISSPRPGGYDLSAREADALLELTRRIAAREQRTPAFAWALSRFDLGAERPNQVEALSDYLLAMRALLEGGGPAKAGLVARAAALCASVEDRDPLRATLERALALERKLMSGDRIAPGDSSPLETIAGVEEMLRTLLRGMATGELGSDLRITSDETLLADGLRVGEASASQLGGTAEWRLPDHEETAEWQIPDLDEAERIVAEHGELSSTVHGPFKAGDGPFDVEIQPPMAERPPKPAPQADWLPDQTERELDWPSFAGRRPRGRRREKPSDRVRYLFPVPETDWSANDLSLGKKRRSG